MIVCSCAVITDTDIKTAVKSLKDENANHVRREDVYKHLSKRPNCGSCAPLMAKILAEANQQGFTELALSLSRLSHAKGAGHERQRQSHRIPQPRSA